MEKYLKENGRTASRLRRIFLNYAWIGIAMIVAASLLDARLPAESQTYFTRLAADFLTTMGIAVTVIAVFS